MRHQINPILFLQSLKELSDDGVYSRGDIALVHLGVGMPESSLFKGELEKYRLRTLGKCCEQGQKKRLVMIYFF